MVLPHDEVEDGGGGRGDELLLLGVLSVPAERSFFFLRRLASAPPRRVVLGSVLGSGHDVWGGDGGGEGVPVKVST